MENSGYGAAHLPSPALVVFSQAAGSLGEALRIQRPFHSQLSDAKELHHLSLVGSYGAHLLHGFPPHLLHPLHPPAVTSASSTFSGGSGAFVKPFPSNFSLPSAFAPPKCLSGIDQKYGFQGMMFGGGGVGGGGSINNNNTNSNNNNNSVPGNNVNNNLNNNNNNNGSGGGGGGTSSESFRTDSSSPACTSLSPPVKEESLEGQTSEEGDRDRICSPPDRSPETPGFRPAPNKTSQGGEPLNLRMENTNGFYPFYRTSMQNAFAKRYLLQQGVGVNNNNNQLKKPMIGGTPPPNACPVCGLQISSTDLETHFLSELDRLYKLSNGNERQKIKASLGLAHHNGPNSQNPGGMEMHHHGQSTPDSRWETFQRIRTNRQGRLRAKTRKRRSDSENEYIDINGVIPPTPMAVCQNCPVCHGRLQRTPEEIAQHIEDCLRKSRNQINQQPMNTDEDETVDVESYGDESSNGAMNMTQSSILHGNNNNNNNITKLESPSGLISAHHHHHHHHNNSHHLHNHHMIHSSHQSPNQNINNNNTNNPNSLSNNREENTISSLSSSSSNSSNTTTLHTPWETTPTRTISAISTTPTISRATPTSSTNQRIDLDYENENDPEAEQDEEVIVDNTDDEDSRTAKRSRNENKIDIKSNSTEEATSSVEIDSATDPNNITKQPQLPTTPDSYVSTSETTEPTSKAQVLEELRARIRELEESPLKGGGGRHQDEANYKCYICKEPFKAPVISTLCWHVHCDDCWITISDIKKSCPQCKIITTINDLKKIQV